MARGAPARPVWAFDSFAGLPEPSEVDGAESAAFAGDCVGSVDKVREGFYPLVEPGGFVVIDDYGAWPGARRATDEFKRATGDRARLVRVDHTGRYWRKR